MICTVHCCGYLIGSLSDQNGAPELEKEIGVKRFRRQMKPSSRSISVSLGYIKVQVGKSADKISSSSRFSVKARYRACIVILIEAGRSSLSA